MKTGFDISSTFENAMNILVNVDRDAILVDFGGGFTDGWVEQRFSNTVKGDLQGLERIVAFINEKIC